MPLINGYKYSCQPCIRGHRATSCNHTDRVLIEVRKPGRPLESCGHRLDTCSCGRLQDIFSIGGVPTTQSTIPQNQDPKAAPLSQIASPILHPRSKSTSSSTSKISKRTTKKKALPSPTTETASSNSPTPTTSPTPQNSYSFSPINAPQPPSQIPQTQIWASTPVHPGSGQLSSSPFTPYQPNRRVLPSPNPNNFDSNNANGTYSVASNNGQSVVEDLRMVSNPNTYRQQGQPYSRSQFIGGGSGFTESRG